MSSFKDMKYICVCVCVCVDFLEQDREGGKKFFQFKSYQISHKKDRG